MKRLAACALAAMLFAPAFLGAQLAPTANAPTTPEDRTKALHALFHDYWEDKLKHEPEFASTIGDKRYNDQITDYSVKAVNDWLAARAGFPDAPRRHRSHRASPTRKRSAANCCMRDLADDQEAAEFKDGRCPSTRWAASTPTIRNSSPSSASPPSRTTTTGSRACTHIPTAFDQVTDQYVHRHGRSARAAEIPARKDSRAGEATGQPEARRLAPRPAAQEVSRHPSPPPSRSASRPRCSTRSPKEVLPAYLRFARFLEVSYIPAGRDRARHLRRCPTAQSTTSSSSSAPPRPTSPQTRFTRSASTK